MAINKVFRVAKNEYVKWITNPKLIIFVVLIVFAYDYVILDLLEAADKMGVKLQIFEGFIGISNSRLLLMIIPIVFVGLMGDFPRIDANAMFYIHRVGKGNWLLGEMLFALMASVTYLAAILGFSVVSLAGSAYMANSWSKVTTHYYLFAPNDYASNVANLTTGRLYNNLKPTSAMIHIVVVMLLFLFMISMILLAFFVCKARLFGVILACGVLCIGNVLAYIETGVRWLFPNAHAIMELHFDEIYRKPIMDMRVSYLYYILCIVVLTGIVFWFVDKYDFTKIDELEE
ncbi:MAG: hypothetical protein UF228_07570 [Lachnospiraceae bacterium]|nr:hypothetical protein [Lachnospiraceae bacterium]